MTHCPITLKLLIDRVMEEPALYWIKKIIEVMSLILNKHAIISVPPTHSGNDEEVCPGSF